MLELVCVGDKGEIIYCEEIVQGNSSDKLNNFGKTEVRGKELVYESEYGYKSDRLIEEINAFIESENNLRYYCVCCEFILLNLYNRYNVKAYKENNVRHVKFGNDFIINENLEVYGKTGKKLSIHGSGFMTFTTKPIIRGIHMVIDILKLAYILFNEDAYRECNITMDNFDVDFKDGIDLKNLHVSQLHKVESSKKPKQSAKKWFILNLLERGILEERRFSYSELSNMYDIVLEEAEKNICYESIGELLGDLEMLSDIDALLESTDKELKSLKGEDRSTDNNCVTAKVNHKILKFLNTKRSNAKKTVVCVN